MIICVRLVPNNGGVLKRALELEDVRITVVLEPETSNVVLVLKVVVLEFEATEVVQEAGSLVIRTILEPTRPSY